MLPRVKVVLHLAIATLVAMAASTVAADADFKLSWKDISTFRMIQRDDSNIYSCVCWV
jgi:hypothetical protein